MEQLVEEARAFAERLRQAKADAAPADFPWYPYDILANVWLLEQVVSGANREFFADLSGKRIVDIGGADGALAFFLETRGARVDVVDNPPTNHNGLRAARLLKAQLQSEVGIHEVDLDRQFELPGEYDFALFLGILYHLKNPFYALEYLATRVRRIALSTRVAALDRPAGQAGAVDISGIPCAYLLDTLESNNDPTNYWIFSEAGLRRLFSRTGWRVLDFQTFGATGRSDPASVDGDERAFALLESTTFVA